MFLRNILLSLAGLLLVAAPALSQSVNVEVVTDDGQVFPTYPVDSQDANSWRSYLQAERGVQYGIRMRNNTDRRIGMVIAVDGRNIISGDKSYLRNTERMYILNPYAEETYRGWRTSSNNIQRFYFTNEGDSYAAAWGDGSAMGVIAVAVYAEHEQQMLREAPGRVAPSLRAPLNSAAEADMGTGFGEREHSSSRRVEFEPEQHPLEKHFYKYESRKSLCKKNIISCRPEHPPRDNRMWDEEDDGYAPHPPGRR